MKLWMNRLFTGFHFRCSLLICLVLRWTGVFQVLADPMAPSEDSIFHPSCVRSEFWHYFTLLRMTGGRRRKRRERRMKGKRKKRRGKEGRGRRQKKKNKEEDTGAEER